MGEPRGVGVCQVKSFAFSAVVHLDLNPFITRQVEIECWKSYCIVQKEFKRIFRPKRKIVDEMWLLPFLTTLFFSIVSPMCLKVQFDHTLSFDERSFIYSFHCQSNPNPSPKFIHLNEYLNLCVYFIEIHCGTIYSHIL